MRFGNGCLARHSALALLAGTALAAAMPAEVAARDVIVVLGASKSMRAALDGRARSDLAREGLAWTLSRLPAASRVAAVTFGDRSTNDCRDTSLAVPPGPLQPAAFSAALTRAQPKGAAPVAEALRLGASLVPPGREGTIILVTDGPDTCKADPCAAAAAIRTANPSLAVHVVALGARPADQPKLACIAEKGGGTFRAATGSADLIDALSALAGTSATAATAGGVSLDIDERTFAGAYVTVPFTGPNEEDDWVGFVPAGSADSAFLNGTHAYTRDGSPAKLTAPSRPGSYELRYVRKDGSVLLARPVRVEESKVSLTAPATSIGAAAVEVAFTGPTGAANFVTIVPAGSPPHTVDPHARSPVTVASPLRIRAPAAPGQHEIRYVLAAGQSTVVGRIPLQVTAAPSAKLVATTAKAGTWFEVNLADAPRVPGDFVYIARPDAPERDYAGGYASVTRAVTTRVFAPRAPGAWEMRYVIPTRAGYVAIGRAPLTVE